MKWCGSWSLRHSWSAGRNFVATVRLSCVPGCSATSQWKATDCKAPALYFQVWFSNPRLQCYFTLQYGNRWYRGLPTNLLTDAYHQREAPQGVVIIARHSNMGAMHWNTSRNRCFWCPWFAVPSTFGRGDGQYASLWRCAV